MNPARGIMELRGRSRGSSIELPSYVKGFGGLFTGGEIHRSIKR